MDFNDLAGSSASRRGNESRRASTSLVILVFLGCTARSAGLPALGVGGVQAIDRMFQAAVDKGEIPGVVAAVMNKDQILYLKGFGKRDVAKGIPMATDTVFRIASMTKPVTSVGIMMLYEQGKLQLDDPAGRYLPAYKGRPVISTFDEKDATYTTRPAKGEMTIRQLLTHTAGLGYPFTSSTILAIQTKTGKDPKELPLLFDPGTKWNYSPGYLRCLASCSRSCPASRLKRGTRQESSVHSGWWTLHTPRLRRGRPPCHGPPAGADGLVENCQHSHVRGRRKRRRRTRLDRFRLLGVLQMFLNEGAGTANSCSGRKPCG